MPTIGPMTEPSGSTARYEFRVWGTDLSPLLERLRAAGDPAPIQESAETYIVPRTESLFNAKIRNEALDIKRLMRTEGPLELWCVHLKALFPINCGTLRDKVCPVLLLDPEDLVRPSYDRTAFVETVIEPSPELTVIRLTKRRRRFDLGPCTAEFTQVHLGGETVDTVAVESEDAEATLEAIARLGLTGEANRNYQQALRELSGIAKPNGDR